MLSPLLFSIYINDLAKAVKKIKGGVKVGKKWINILFYADDIVVLAKRKKNLQKMADAVSEFGVKWRCSFNNKKSQVVKHGHRGVKSDEPDFPWLGGKQLKCVNFYKYLGI